ncbi:unnamed protein product [Symbiodinium microadriaticum]|nr:unnamed protein product [Symbiodinium microadriaticum]
MRGLPPMACSPSPEEQLEKLRSNPLQPPPELESGTLAVAIVKDADGYEICLVSSETYHQAVRLAYKPDAKIDWKWRGEAMAGRRSPTPDFMTLDFDPALLRLPVSKSSRCPDLTFEELTGALRAALQGLEIPVPELHLAAIDALVVLGKGKDHVIEEIASLVADATTVQVKHDLSRPVIQEARHTRSRIRQAVRFVATAVRAGPRYEDNYDPGRAAAACPSGASATGRRAPKWCHALGRLPHVAERGNERAIDGVLAGLSSPEEDVRHKALSCALPALVEPGDSSAVWKLVALLRHRDRRIRETAVEALPVAVAASEEGRRTAVHSCASLLDSSDGGATVRFEGFAPSPGIALGNAMANVAEVGDESAAAVAIACLHDADRDIRCQSIELLAKIAPKGDIQALLSMVNCLDDVDPDVRATALRCLPRLAAPGSGSRVVLDVMIRRLSSPEGHVRHSATSLLPCLAPRGDTPSLDALMPRLHDVHIDIRVSAAHAIAALMSPADRQTMRRLAESLEDDHKAVRRAVLQALLATDAELDEKAVQTLQERLEDGCFDDAWRHARDSILRNDAQLVSLESAENLPRAIEPCWDPACGIRTEAGALQIEAGTDFHFTPVRRGEMDLAGRAQFNPVEKGVCAADTLTYSQTVDTLTQQTTQSAAQAPREVTCFAPPAPGTAKGIRDEKVPPAEWYRIASMEPTRSEIIRGVPVHCALQGCGQALRGRLGRRRLFQLSRPTRRIDEFWSHSWHASGWMKYVTACYLNTAAIAAAFGMAGALLGFVLFAGGALPATVENNFCTTQWAVFIGVTFYCLSLMCWRVRRLVFLDLLCIDQDDETLKGEAMISMGAILKSSASMLVLWDPSWVQRFWCVFELASFLRSRKHSATASQHLSIRPNLMGPVFFAGQAGLVVLVLAWPLLIDALGSSLEAMTLTLSTGLVPCFLCLVHIARNFCCNLDTLQHQLAKFRVSDAMCWCCTVDHVDDETGEPLFCDREIMLRCIGIWFGSSTDFEHLVQGHVRTTLLQRLTSPVYLYQQIVLACSPVMWLFCDRLATLVAHDEALFGVPVLLGGLAWWLLVIPSLVLMGLGVAYKFRAKQACWVLDLLFSLAVLVVPSAILAAFVLLYIFTIEAVFHASEWSIAAQIMVPGSFIIASALLATFTHKVFWVAKHRAICE